ncbi:MAG TPA: B12-binding domain-containing protein [Friedmanniella sp.]
MSSVSDPSTPIVAIPAILLAVRAMNPSSIVTLLDDAVERHGLDVTIDEVVFPVLRVVGTFWASGTLDVAHEHLLSSAVTRWVYAQLQHQRISRRGRVLLAAGPHDLHVLGLDCFELLLARRGVEVANLGGQIPTESLVLAATSAGATAVVVCSHNPTATTQAARAVRAVSVAGFPVYYAGSSFDSRFVRQHTPGDALYAPLSVSADLLTRRHTVAAAAAESGSVRSAAQLTA